MSTVGQQLRQAREARNMSIPQAAEFLKVRADHIRALEEGNFTVFSAPVYIRGFVRTYATMLKLEVRPIITALDAELGRTEKFAEPPPLSNEPRGPVDFLTLQLSKVDWRKAGVAVGVLAVVLLTGWAFWMRRHHNNSDSLTGLKPGMYQSENVSGDMLPVPPPKQAR
jgi:cytoskeletal protein RodZ